MTGLQTRASLITGHDMVNAWIAAADYLAPGQPASCRYLTDTGWSPPQPEGGYVPKNTVMHATREEAEAALRHDPLPPYLPRRPEHRATGEPSTGSSPPQVEQVGPSS